MNDLTQSLSGMQTNTSSSLTLKERLEAKKLAKNLCLILDVSGSMAARLSSSEDENERKRRIDMLREAVAAIAGSPKTIAFNSLPIFINKNEIPEPSGGTNLLSALDLAKIHQFKQALLLTDGEASAKEACLEFVKTNDFKLQIMYIGDGEIPQFLKDLAAAAGSLCTMEDLSKPKELTAKIQLLLGAAEEAKGPICL